MQLGLTFPLQRKQKIKAVPYGAPLERLFCWDAHVISLRGRDSLLLVHCETRYTVTVCGVRPADWARLPAFAAEQLRVALLAAGFPAQAVALYFETAGAFELTRTHGRREVAFLNRAWDDIAAHDCAADLGAQPQPALNALVNALPRRCAGRIGPGAASELLAAALRGGKV